MRLERVCLLAFAALFGSASSAHAVTLTTTNSSYSQPGGGGTIYYYPMVAATCPAPTVAAGSACFNSAAGSGSTNNSCGGLASQGASYNNPVQQGPVSVGGLTQVSALNPFNLTAPATPSGQDTNTKDLNIQDVALKFNIVNTIPLATISGGMTNPSYSIRVEVGPSGGSALPLLSLGGAYNLSDTVPINSISYPTSNDRTGSIAFAIPLRDLVGTNDNAGTFQSQNGFPPNAFGSGNTGVISGLCTTEAGILGIDSEAVCSPTGGTAAQILSFKVGIMAGGITNGTLETTSFGSFTLSPDTTTIQIVLADCPPGAPAAPSGAGASVAGAFTVISPLQFSITPGDQQVTVVNSNVFPLNILSPPPDGVPIVGLDLVGSFSSTVPAAAPVQRPQSSPNPSTLTVSGLPNDQQICFSIGYVNATGWMTTDASYSGNMAPANGNCATASEIDGFLNRSTCFIATAAYGDEWDTHLETLRQFRDEVLEQLAPGRAFVDWYYSWSPQAAHWLMANPSYKAIVRAVLLPLVGAARISLWIRANMWVFGIALLLGTMAAVLVGVRRRTTS